MKCPTPVISLGQSALTVTLGQRVQTLTLGQLPHEVCTRAPVADIPINAVTWDGEPVTWDGEVITWS